MKKLILIMLLMMTAQAWGDTTKVVYIITATDTTVRNANVDSIRYDIVNDPQNQLPGIWKVDLCRMADVEGKDAAYWAYYDLIITWGGEETQYTAGPPYLDQILDTIHKPIICRDAYVAKGDPMFMGSAAYASSILWAKVSNKTNFITRQTYTDNYNYGDSIAVYSSLKDGAHSIRGMANDVTTLVRLATEIRSDDADTALVAILEAGETNASGGTAAGKRAYFGLIPSWRYASWTARDLWYRTLRWAIADTVIDTCVTKIQLSREAIDGTFLEHSGDVCQISNHYGPFTLGFLCGFDERDRATIIRARTTAITTQLPDTSATWAYDLVDAKLYLHIKGIAEENPALSFSWWEGLFEVLYDTVLWVDYKIDPTERIQLDSTCSAWDGAKEHSLSNSIYLRYPDVAWDSYQASTRGTDYSMVAFDSVWIQDPVVSNYMIFGNLLSYIEEARGDSAANQGLITHTIGTTTNDGEITLTTENTMQNFVAVRNSPLFQISLQWRPANEAAGDLDSSIAFNPDSVIFSGYVNGTNPTARTLAYFNRSSGEYFGCDAVIERPTASWLTQVTQGDGYITNSVDLDGLTAGYYSTYLVLTCTGVSDSPDSAKVILHVNPVPSRPTGGKLKF